MDCIPAIPEPAFTPTQLKRIQRDDLCAGIHTSVIRPLKSSKTSQPPSHQAWGLISLTRARVPQQGTKARRGCPYAPTRTSLQRQRTLPEDWATHHPSPCLFLSSLSLHTAQPSKDRVLCYRTSCADGAEQAIRHTGEDRHDWSQGYQGNTVDSSGMDADQCKLPSRSGRARCCPCSHLPLLPLLYRFLVD